jgi:hypothetical protein
MVRFRILFNPSPIYLNVTSRWGACYPPPLRRTNLSVHAAKHTHTHELTHKHSTQIPRPICRRVLGPVFIHVYVCTVLSARRNRWELVNFFRLTLTSPEECIHMYYFISIQKEREPYLYYLYVYTYVWCVRVPTYTYTSRVDVRLEVFEGGGNAQTINVRIEWWEGAEKQNRNQKRHNAYKVYGKRSIDACSRESCDPACKRRKFVP